MIVIENLTLQYPDGLVALNNVSCRMSVGSKVALLGANGAGKSSLLSALVGLISLKEGEVYIDGLKLQKDKVKEIRKKVGLVFQNPDDQLFCPTVMEDISFGPRNMNLSDDEIKERVEDVVGDLHLEEIINRLPQRLSGGEKKLVSIAGVLAMRPEIILFDEPTAQLDPRARRELSSVIKNLKQTCLIATHDIAFAKEVCSDVIVLDKGSIAADGRLSSISDDKELFLKCGLA